MYRSILSGAAWFSLRSRRACPERSRRNAAFCTTAPASFDCVPAKKQPELRSGCLRSASRLESLIW